MIADELRGLSDDELEARVRDLREQAFKLRSQMTTGQAASGSRLRGVRREIARALTVLRERELAASKTDATAAAS